MKRICFISQGHPSAAPRMVRSADAMAAAGFQVSVITPRFLTKWIHGDEALEERSRWRHLSINYMEYWTGRTRWKLSRLRMRLCAAVLPLFPFESIVSRACGLGNPELVKLAIAERADLYIAHQHHSLPAAAWAAAKVGTPLGFDAEDLLSGYSKEPYQIHRRVEEMFLKRCDFVTTMSPQAAEWLQDQYALEQTPVVIRNVSMLKRRRGVKEPRLRPRNKIPSLYWMGQTIGPHSCAEHVLTAMKRLSFPVRLVLQGFPDADYVKKIRAFAQNLGLGERLEIRDAVPISQLTQEAARHDVELATQPTHEPFHELAIGNKAMIGFNAGMALLLADTLAYRKLMEQAPGCGLTCPSDQPDALVSALQYLLGDRKRLLAMKQRSWDLGTTQFNWEKESEVLLSTVKKALWIL